MLCILVGRGSRRGANKIHAPPFLGKYHHGHIVLRGSIPSSQCTPRCSSAGTCIRRSGGRRGMQVPRNSALCRLLPRDGPGIQVRCMVQTACICQIASTFPGGWFHRRRPRGTDAHSFCVGWDARGVCLLLWHFLIHASPWVGAFRAHGPKLEMKRPQFIPWMMSVKNQFVSSV